MAWSEGDAEYVVGSLEEGLALSRSVGDERGQAIGHLILGLGLIDAGATSDQQAQTHFNDALRLCRAIGERWGEALALNYLGLIPLLGGEFDRAITYLEESLAVARLAGDDVAAHLALYGLVLAAQAAGNHERAAAFGEGLRLAMGLGTSSTPAISSGGSRTLPASAAGPLLGSDSLEPHRRRWRRPALPHIAT